MGPFPELLSKHQVWHTLLHDCLCLGYSRTLCPGTTLLDSCNGISEGLGLGNGEVGVVKKKKVKLEGAASLSWVEPLYAEQPSLCWNRSDPVTRAAFEKAYGLSKQGIPPKRLKFGVHLEESEVDELFGPRVGSNGYSYSYSEDTEFVKRVERLWMITH